MTQRGAIADRLSGADRLLLSFLAGLVAVAASCSPIRNYDYWWHLKTGALILAQRSVPRADPFSFTARGAPWIDHEWLFQVLLYLAHVSIGPSGLVLLKVGLVLGLAALLAAHLRSTGLDPAARALLLALSLLGMAFRLDVRPELATLLLLPLSIDAVMRARASGRGGFLWLVPLYVLLGINLHVGAILIPILLLPAALLCLVDERRPLFARSPGESVPPRFAGRLLLATLVSFAAAGLNPRGFRIYAVPFELRRLLESLPSPNLEWSRPGPADFPLFWASLVGAALLVAAFRRRCDPIGTTAMILAGGLAVLHLRNIGLFFALLPHGLAGPLRGAIELAGRIAVPHAAPGRGAVRPGFVVAAVILAVAAPLPVVLPPAVAWGAGVAPENEPRGAVDFLQREGIGRRLYNDVRFGGYLVWRRYPAERVFVDGRNEVYPDLLRDIFASLPDSRAWQAFLDRQGIDAAFLRFAPSLERVVRPGPDGRPAAVVERAFSVNHFPTQDWALVYWDDDAMILAKRTPENAPVIARHEYRAIQPEDWRYLYAGVLTGHAPLAPILQELQEKLRQDPGCARARALYTTFAALAGAAGKPGGRDPAAE